MFSDDDFAEIYCPDNGRDSVPPGLLATALLLQTYDQVSDAESSASGPGAAAQTYVAQGTAILPNAATYLYCGAEDMPSYAGSSVQILAGMKLTLIRRCCI